MPRRCSTLGGREHKTVGHLCVAFRGAFGPHEGIVLEQATTAKAVARNHYLTLPPQCDLRNGLCAWRAGSRIES
jgi:hypothetical protein